MSQHGNIDDDEEEEAECRVCRGTEEEDRPLYKPCKCSGSIGWTHQDCLQSWLAVNHATKCELCGTAFRFSNQYAANTPDRLPMMEVLLGVTRNLLATWLPFWLRIAVAAALWLVVAPLLTALIYHGWMHGTMLFTGTNVVFQFRWSVLADELVSGAVLVAFILFSFLSLMSFVDFLRAEWQEPRLAPQRGAAAARQPAAAATATAAQNPPEPEEADIDSFIWTNHLIRKQQQQIQQQLQQISEQHKKPKPGNEPRPSDDLFTNNHDVDEERLVSDESRRQEQPETDPPPPRRYPIEFSDDEEEQEVERVPDDEEHRPQNDFLDEDEEEVELPVAEDIDFYEEEEEEAQLRGPMGDNNIPDNDNNNNNDNIRNDLLDDDPVLDADLNIALDELLGVRGPLWIVVRNLLWLLAFNTLYLALFAFVPKVIGAMTVSLWRMNSTSVVGGVLKTAALNSSAVARAESSIANETAEVLIADNNENHTSAIIADTDHHTFVANITEAIASRFLEEVANITFYNDSMAETEITMTNVTTIAETSTTNVTTITDYSLSGIFNAIEQESDRLDTTFRLKDFALVSIGYTCAAITIVFMRFMWIMARHKSNHLDRGSDDEDDDQDREWREPIVELNRALQGNGLEMDDQGHIHRVGQHGRGGGGGGGINHAHFNNNNNNPALNPNFDEDGNVPIGYAVDVMLDAAASIVKVGVLLFLKMFLLPVMLGFCLDLSTVSLFQRTVDEIILYSGQDLFSFLFLHWVAGISFMLLVTVSVLQLREVAHPYVLAHIIRPQEPQPDLLGNLLHDPLLTHGRRLILSLVIYVLLLILQVHVPAKLFVAAGAGEYWKLKFSYWLTPRLQIPIELCIFHLCMLAFLEKNKNSIGEIQHYWLKFICGLMDLGNCVLPHEVERFQLVGTRKVFETQLSVDPFWHELANESSALKRQKMIDAKIHSRHFAGPALGSQKSTPGETATDGTRVIHLGSNYIRLPGPDGAPVLLPTKSGRYRLNRSACLPASSSLSGVPGSWRIELWVEVPGEPIPRPPEGWDDLGQGGADVQGRWAWDREKKSKIEAGVAQRSVLYTEKRKSFVGKSIVTGKIVLLILLSWIAGTLASSILLASPLVMGRFLFSLLRLPSDYTHDPLCFAMGSSVVFPLLRRLMAFFKTSDRSLFARFLHWLRSARAPSLRKLMILGSTGLFWFGFMPALIGVSYDALFLWSNDRFASQGFQWDTKEVVLSWTFGNVLLSGWSACCVVGVLTREFWASVFFNDPGRAENLGDPSSWQGTNGKMSRFWGVWKAVLLGWEWDKVDNVILLDECVLPILRMVLSVLVIPGMATAALAGWLIQQAYSVPVVARLSTALLTMLYIGFSCEDQMSRWFDAAHRTARDDRYLIGQLLLNHRD